MAAHLLRLRVALLVNGFRRSVWQTIGFVLGALYVLGIVALCVGGTVALGLGDPTLAGRVLVVGGALLVLGWWVGPLIAFGLDATLDPALFATYGIPPRRLVPGLALGALVGIGGGALVLFALGSAFAWVRNPLALLVALVGGVLAVATCVLGSRALTAILAPVLQRRRSREITGLVGVLVGAAAWFAFVRLSNGTEISLDALDDLLGTLAGVLAWTPFGAPWALAGDVHDGAWGALALRLVLVLATLALAAWAWAWAIGRAMTQPAHDGAASRPSRGGLGWFDRFPATPTGAVAARAATYWQRDPRYAMSLVVVPLVPVAIVVLTGGDLRTPALLVAGPVVAWVMAFGISNDVSYDSTAFALHASTGVSGRADRAGRAAVVIGMALPMVLALVLGTGALTGRWDLVPLALGVSLSTLGVGLGVASVVSVLYLYPSPRPGDNPFKSPQGSGTATLVAQLLAVVLGGALSIPVLVLAGAALAAGSLALGWATLALGAGAGVLVLVLGVRQGARVYERRLPELLQQVVSYR